MFYAMIAGNRHALIWLPDQTDAAVLLLLFGYKIRTFVTAAIIYNDDFNIAVFLR